MRGRKWIRVSFLLVILAGIGNAATAIASISSVNSPSGITVVAFVIAFLMLTLVTVVLEYRSHIEVTDKVNEEVLEEIQKLNLIVLTELLRIARHSIAPPLAQARACIFLLDPQKDELYIYRHSGAFDDAEAALRFERFQGVVGKVFWQWGKPRHVNLENATVDELEQQFNMRPEQIDCTTKLKSILVVPISLPNDPSRVIGVLSIDSQQAEAISGLTSVEIVDKMLNLVSGEFVRFIDSTKYRVAIRPGHGIS